MTHQQIIKLAAQAESEGNYRYADFLDRELVRVGFGIFKGFGLGAEKGLAKGLGKEITEVGIQRAFNEGTEAGTGAALRSMETVAPKSGNLLQEAGGMIFGKGNKVITRTIEELIQAETKINQIITRIANLQSQFQIKNANIVKQIQGLEKQLTDLPANNPQRALYEARINTLKSSLNESSNAAANIATKHLRGEKLTQAEMELLYKEILKTDPTAFAGKSTMRPSDAYDMLVNGKITNPNMNRILGSAEKFMYAPDFKGSKWGTGLMAAGLGYAGLKYGLPLLGAGVAGAGAGAAAINNAINPNQAASAAGQGGNVQGGSSTYGLGRDNASVGTNQYYANRAPSSTVASNKTKWIKTSDL